MRGHMAMLPQCKARRPFRLLQVTEKENLVKQLAVIILLWPCPQLDATGGLAVDGWLQFVVPLQTALC